MFDWSDAFIIVTGKITVTDPNNNAYDKKLALKNNVPFFCCVTKTDNTLIDDCQDLDIVMPMYNLLYCSKNYQKTSGSLYNYYMDEPNDGAKNGINYPIKDSKSFDYKTSITEKLERKNAELENIKVTVPLKYLSKFFRTLDILLINCEIKLDLKWSKNCVLTSKATRPAGDDPVPNPVIDNPTDAKFDTTDCKLYVPVVSLSTEYENKLCQQLKEAFTINVYWDKYSIIKKKDQ